MKSSANQRGLERQDFATKSRVLRRSTTRNRQLINGLGRPNVVAFLILGLGALGLWMPLVWELLVLLQLMLFIGVHIRCLTHYGASPRVPNHLPRGAKAKHDPNHRVPGQSRGGPPSGDMFLGIEKGSNKQVWFRFKDWLRHAMVTGTTGSGKTELLLSIVYNFLCAGGNGVMFADPKADLKAAYKLAWIAKRFGREDDLFICNYIAPRSDHDTVQDTVTTNTCNPTQLGSAKEVATMLMSLLPKNDGGTNAVFADNAITLTQVLSRCLVALRDAGHLVLSWSTFRAYLNLEACIGLTQSEALSNQLRQEMSLFVFSIAGVDARKQAHEQSHTAHEQFAYIASYCQRGLATLTGSFGYIYDCVYGDFSYDDVVSRHRILLSLLPSLQNTQEEIRMLGKIDLFGKKQALSKGLATQIEGSLRQLDDEQRFSRAVPSLNIMDEYKYISVPGMSVAATQGRSLGWASVVGVQSYAGLMVDGEHEADEWLENTSTKFIGSAQGDSTFNKLDKIVGSEYVARSEGTTQNAEWWMARREKLEARYDKLSILDIRDVRAQIEGEFTLIVHDREIRMQSVFIETPIDTPLPASHAGMLINSFIDLSPARSDDRSHVILQSQFYDTLFSGALQFEMMA